MAGMYHQCVGCGGLVEFIANIVPCKHRGEDELHLKPSELEHECDCPVQFVYVPPQECSRASCPWDWMDEETFERKCIEWDSFYDEQEENKNES